MEHNCEDVKKIVVFDTSISSDNIGDEIIMNSFYKQMNFLLNDYFIMKYSTHTPILREYQRMSLNDPLYRCFDEAKYKFLGGTNIFKRSMFVIRADWNLNIFDSRLYKDVIAVGCGTSIPDSMNINLYTKQLYKKILNKDYYHSVRDEKTKKFLERLGVKAINTGCVTLWELNKEHCTSIPEKKADSVVLTLTGYNADEKNDKLIIDILKKTYNKVYFWPQGIGDLEYFNSLGSNAGCLVIQPTLLAFSNLLKNNEVDYCGTRLHGGIFSMQHKRRTIIISIDNRAVDMDETFNLKCISRNNVKEELEDRINNNFKTQININENAIREWKKQFC